MLVRQDASSEEQERSFKTVFADEGSLRETRQFDGADLSSSSTVADREVYPIAKRPGAAFADRIGAGRAPNADISVPLPQISKYHAFFSENGGDWTITDAGSKNGTFLDNKRLPAKEPFPIADGAEVKLGPYRFSYYTPDGFIGYVRSQSK